MKWVIFIVLISTQMSCISTLFGSQDAKSSSYKLAAPGPDWEPIDPADADAAYRHKVDMTVINVSSYCGDERLRPLEELSADILRQLPAAELLQPLQKQLVSGHSALLGEARGAVDASPLEVRFAVIRSPRCVYDLILAGQHLSEGNRAAFNKVLEDFPEGG